MIVNKDIIKSFKPCEDGYDNYLKWYKNFNGSFDDFLDLKYIPYNNKIWLALNILTKHQLVTWSIMCADSIVDNFEKVYHKDKRVRDCIEYLKIIKDFDKLTEKQLIKIEFYESAVKSAKSVCPDVKSAWTAVRSAESDWFVVRSTESAVWSAVWSADESAEKQQEFLNLQFLKLAASL